MKRIALLIASIVAAAGCSAPTVAPMDKAAAAKAEQARIAQAKAAQAKAALEAASQSGPSARLAGN